MQAYGKRCWRLEGSKAEMAKWQKRRGPPQCQLKQVYDELLISRGVPAPPWLLRLRSAHPPSAAAWPAPRPPSTRKRAG